jgi:hypothetical protein
MPVNISNKFDLIENLFYLDKGLGKDNQGMKTALKPVLKFDTRGVNNFLLNSKIVYNKRF